jgi:hypothetical protein
MTNIIQSVIASIVVAIILGILAYTLVIRENQIYISLLKEQVSKTEKSLEEHGKSINEIRVLIAQSLPKRKVFSFNSSGVSKQIDIPAIETAVIVSGAKFTEELGKYASQKSDKPTPELIKAKEQYEFLLKLAKQYNSDTLATLTEFKSAIIDRSKTDEELYKAHNIVNDLKYGPGKNNEIVKAREKLLRVDNGEVSNFIKDPKAVSPWNW